jgi:hypothetical protein
MPDAAVVAFAGLPVRVGSKSAERRCEDLWEEVAIFWVFAEVVFASPSLAGHPTTITPAHTRTPKNRIVFILQHSLKVMIPPLRRINR